MRGREQVFDGKCVVRSAGVRLGCGGVRKCSGREKIFGGEWVVRSAGVHLGCGGGRKCSGRARRCAGTGEGLQWGMGGEVGGFNALSPQPLARTRIIIYTSAAPPL